MVGFSANGAHALEPGINALMQMTPGSQEIVLNLIQSLGEREGINVAHSPAPGLQTPADGMPMWLAKLRAEGHAKRTIEGYALVVRKYLVHDPCPTSLSIRAYLAARLGKVSTATVNNERKALRSFFSFLHEEGLWNCDPTARIKSIKVRYHERECPTEEQIERLLQAKCYRNTDTTKYKMMVALLIDTGLRVTEAASILKRDINFELLEIRVIGKGNKERVVPISPLTANLLRAYISQDGDSEWLFPSDNALGYWDIRSFEKTLRRVCKSIGIKPVTPHQFRHFYATTALKRGAKLEVISRILGHSDVGITAKVYRHINMNEIHTEHQSFGPFSAMGSLLPAGRSTLCEKPYKS